MRLLLLTLAILVNLPAPAHRAPTLAERLGYKASDRLLIINGDDVGMCHTANLATIDCMEHGLLTSATIMVPCPWFTEIARYAKAHPERDFGVHLCHTSEWQTYRWGPVAPKSAVPGLVDPEGYLWRDESDVWKHSTPEQAEAEARAQIKMAMAAGVDVTHLDSHMGALQLDPRYHEVYVKLAKEFNLPLRMGSQTIMAAMGQPKLREKIAAMGIIFPDYLNYETRPGKKETLKADWMAILRGLKPGVTEIFLHCGMRTDELRAITGSWEVRSMEHDLFTTDPDIRNLMDELQIKRIGYRTLRDLQRKSH